VIPLGQYLAVAGAMFTIGSIGFLVRRSLLFQLMAIELMLNAVVVTLVAFNRMRQDDHAGQLFAFFVVAVAAAEAAVGLSIVIAFYRLRRSARSDEASILKH
jgi:NADH-quinone oxidoreductase subunit K